VLHFPVELANYQRYAIDDEAMENGKWQMEDGK
jgi:hypothetical protein